MPSPFPGMDPWLERPAVFPTVHGSMVTYAQEALNRVLPPGYLATTDNRVYVDPEARRVPDVGVFGPDAAPPGGAATAVLSRYGLLAAGTDPRSDPVEEAYLEILSGDDDRLVTVIEVLSPTNKKPGEEGQASYRHKQEECRAGGVNLVEIDLLRGGAHTTAVPEARLRGLTGGAYDYHVCVTVAGVPREFYVAPVRLADRLPTVGVPLDPGVEPVPLDLQAVFDRCYDAGRYAQLAKYGRRDPDPPLTPEQKAWADAILKEKGLLP
ncbi:MAG: DUF4058 family protein [Gemmataceae bacterium]